MPGARLPTSLDRTRASLTRAPREALGAAVASAFRRAPVVFHMLGPMDARPKARKAAAQKQKKKAPATLGVAGLARSACHGPSAAAAAAAAPQPPSQDWPWTRPPSPPGPSS